FIGNWSGNDQIVVINPFDTADTQPTEIQAGGFSKHGISFRMADNFGRIGEWDHHSFVVDCIAKADQQRPIWSRRQSLDIELGFPVSNHAKDRVAKPEEFPLPLQGGRLVYGDDLCGKEYLALVFVLAA
ncbi:hypothetical protein ACCT20_36595, partial [Rhizobium ruizarguesonis]